ncbi:extracellular solute-binding protein [Paenibacillus nanensis]|uniref:Extracellular solute-binding protein n=1 Tax=Paenibacillus nanensis TaxID=393251 RepID=A0A3A1VFM7_9BACL|nr:ABC transporter substrate-binding protein [Paenibacillus nanensis]RIX59718.1 extracellular solute-binding protein [Paenibacillus nanensis]
MFNKKWIIGLALVILAASVLAACSSGNGSNGGNQGTEPKASKGAQNEGEKENEKPVNLIWYTIGTPPNDLKKVNDELNAYILPKINATVEMRMLDWGDYSQKMQVTIASGEPYDIAFTSSWANDYFANAKKGAFYELDALLQEKGQGILQALNPAFLEGTKVNGHHYGLPTNKELPQQRVFRFNKTMLDKNGLDISGVRTIQDLAPILKAFQEKEPTIPPIPAKIAEFLPYDLPINDLPFIGMPLDTTDYKLINVWETPEAMRYLETMHEYYKAGYLPKDVATQTDAGDYFKTGKWLLDVADAQPYADNLWSSDAGYEVVSVPMHDPIAFNWSVAGAMQAINAKSKHPDKAMEFLNLLYTDPYVINLIDYGIENVHYTKTGDQSKDSIPDSGYGFPAFTVGNLMLTYLNTGDPADKWEKFKAFNDSATNSPLLGFQVDTTNITTELANLKNAKEATYNSLFSGTLDPKENLPKVNQKLKDNGLDKVMQEVQRQIDEWRANQK